LLTRSLLAILALALAAWAADAPLFSPDKLREHVFFLAGPELKGRGTGTPEIDQAADYIAKQFAKAGLEPLAEKSYFQKFSVTVGARLGKRNRVETLLGAERRAAKPAEEFLPLNFSDSGTARVPVVFAGYGITAPEFGYDDYFHLDVKGAAVIVLRHEPQEDDEKSVFAGRQLTTHAEIVSKAINARNQGARAMILVNDPLPHADEPDTLVRFGTLAGPDNAGLLVIQVKRAVADEWLASGGRTLADLQKQIDAGLQPQSFRLSGLEIEIGVEVERLSGAAKNVAGVIRGADPKLKEEAIIIGAHYDHLGTGTRSSLAPSQAGEIHPGADDNASGTAALLELARVISERRKELRRSVIFLAFSAEELGLLGSAHYTKNPLWPLERTAAMINLDMVGRARDTKIHVGGIGTSPAFERVLAEARRDGLEITPAGSGGFGSSDHQSFYVKNIPVLFFFSGLHADYHKPSDLPDRIQYEGLARVAELAYHTARGIDALGERPQFVRVAEPRPATGGGGPGYGAYFGSIPDMGEEVNGVKFADVRDGSPAAQAGLKAGDLLVEFAGKEIKNLYDFTYALRSHRPGEEVLVTVLRGSERLSVTVKLGRRQ